MSRALREAVADWLMLLGALVLAISLFLVWSHQSGAAVPGIARDPTAWQVYSAADVLLAALAGALVYVSFLGTRRARAVALVPCLVALAFVVHALSVPPTNGAALTGAIHAASGAGEVVAIAGLGAALSGLLVSFTAD